MVRRDFREALAHSFRILGEGQLSLTKVLLVTDVELDLRDFPQLLETILMRLDPGRDLIILHHTSMDTLDYTGRKFNQGSKAIIIGIGSPVRELPREYNGSPLPGIKKIKPYWCCACSYPEKAMKKTPGWPRSLAQQPIPTCSPGPW